METTCPQTVMNRKAELMQCRPQIAKQDGVDEVLLFIVDILKKEATLLIPNKLTKSVAEKSFGIPVKGDTVKLEGCFGSNKDNTSIH